jgi:hypothetical protein
VEAFASYNGAIAQTQRLQAGVILYRVVDTESLNHWPAHSFNSTNIADLEDTRTLPLTGPVKPGRAQGRFDPVHDEWICKSGSSLGGYIYLGLTPGAAFAEGVFRNKRMPKSGRISRNWLRDKSVAKIELRSDTEVIPLDDTVTLRTLGFDSSFVSAPWERYYETRISATNMLVKNDSASGVRYPCRHDGDHKALMLVERDIPPILETLDTIPLDEDGWGLDLFEQYVSRFPSWFLGPT